MILADQLRKIIFFYFFMLLANLGVFFYEVFIIKILIEQSLIFRGVALVTDGFMSVLFISSSKNLELRIFKIFNLNIKSNWVQSGLKLAVIAPSVYLLKLFLVNSSFSLFKFGIAPVEMKKILLAYTISFFVAFFWGSIWDLFLKDMFTGLSKEN